jgi:hypothetical protein
LPGASQRLRGKRFIDLNGVYFIQPSAGLLTQPSNCMDWAETHRGWITTHGGAGDDAGAR